ncbi:uncharacterized protein LOC116608016 isoform X2 [Nematostella vectensis]|nr:uncharacterized protein LOC116608016 isoform X2 [Nematostella vectensis]XP_032225253.1 uncharacterized protein LOC116608016 isoform X2 [Nematostella vectensis]XP_032225254.1 uncharacterized protein LOC116608016 isoform X2 [Nematostella vectensis]
MASLQYLSVCTSLLLLVCFLNVGRVSSTEVKSGQLYQLCGDQFLSAYTQCCENPAGCEGSTRKREMKEGDKSILSPETEAKRFLQFSIARDRVRRGILSKRSAGGGTNPVEECCSETCSLAEVAEYDCV